MIDILVERLHSVVSFDYIALGLPDSSPHHVQLLVLEPANLPQPAVFVLELNGSGPTSALWQVQAAGVVTVPAEALDAIQAPGRSVTCSVPLMGSHERLGVLVVGSSRDSDYSPEAVQQMQHAASHIAVAVDYAFNIDRQYSGDHEHAADSGIPGGAQLREATMTSLRQLERDGILRALKESHGIVGGPRGAAARLGMKRTTLQSMMQRLGIRRPSYE